MAQFDVYSNPRRTTQKIFPYLVDIQNPVIEHLATRIVIPLGMLDRFKHQTLKGLAPEIDYKGVKYILLVPQLASIPAKSLKNPIGSLSHLRDEIIASLDFAITGI
ncbi:CcdB family protein [Neptuniibacter halophilus]|uniref:CcdB family protein n=1 Tax=Neptuniibacter halophilus TaxID=651666 RepID=UPI0025725C50|nr:CcdB family protein [Neptuniibacter halophilus]